MLRFRMADSLGRQHEQEHHHFPHHGKSYLFEATSRCFTEWSIRSYAWIMATKRIRLLFLHLTHEVLCDATCFEIMCVFEERTIICGKKKMKFYGTNSSDVTCIHYKAHHGHQQKWGRNRKSSKLTYIWLALSTSHTQQNRLLFIFYVWHADM